MDRVIVYCRTYDSCSMIYLYIKSCLGKEITEPVGSLDLARFRLVDMFSACTTAAVKDSILNSFCSAQGTLRVVIATVAFGLGLNCPNVRRIVHWGPAGDIEQYLQETGRAGRDGLPSQAILHVADLRAHPTEETMKEYYKNKTKCRRELLLSHFEQHTVKTPVGIQKCKCCDICEKTCNCASCSTSESIHVCITQNS